MSEENPFTSPATAAHLPTPSRASRIYRFLWWFAYLHPAITTGLIYASWGLTALQLGRPPVPYREYPDGFGIAVTGWGAALSFLAGPVIVPAAIINSLSFPFASFEPRDASFLQRAVCGAGYVAIFALSVWIWLTDPFRVIDWFWD